MTWTETWRDDFAGSAIDAIWTKDPHNGSLSEGGGYQRHWLVAPANGYWLGAGGAKNPIAARVRIADLWSTAGEAAALVCVEASLTILGSVWDDHGICLYQDDENFSGVTIIATGGAHDGRCRTFKGVADVFVYGAATGAGAFAPILFRVYHNGLDASMAVANGDALAPGQVRSSLSRDSGTTWTAVAAAEALVTTPTYAQLFCCTTQPGLSIETRFNYVEITRTLLFGPAPADIKRTLLDLYPPGAYPDLTDRNGDDTFHADILEMDARALADGQDAADQLELEVFPQTAEQTLDEWEAALGIDVVTTDTAERQAMCRDAASAALLLTPANLRAMLGELLASVYGF